ncbi:MAG: AzlD domain-containing protein [Ktedonobacterales bacterium]
MVLALSVLTIGVATYAMRLSLIGLSARVSLPLLVRRALRYVPVAALTALVVPELIAPGGTLDVTLGNARLWAGVLAIVVAWRTRNVLLTIAVGMAALWLLTWLTTR